MAESLVSIVTWVKDGEAMADVYTSEEIALTAHPEFRDIEPDKSGDRHLPDGTILLSPRPIQTGS